MFYDKFLNNLKIKLKIKLKIGRRHIVVHRIPSRIVFCFPSEINIE